MENEFSEDLFLARFEQAKKCSWVLDEHGTTTKETETNLRENIKSLTKQLMKHDRDAGLLILFACYWNEYRSPIRNDDNIFVDDFCEYLRFLEIADPKHLNI